MSTERRSLIPLPLAVKLIDEARADDQSSRSWVYRRAAGHAKKLGSRKFIRRADLERVFGEDVAEIVGQA